MTNDKVRAFVNDSLIAYAFADDVNFQNPKHIRTIAENLEAVENGQVKRLMIFMPPRHGKSHLCSKYFPAWYLGKHPDHQIIHSTYAQEFAEEFGRKIRNLIAEKNYPILFSGVTLADDSTSAKRFHTNKGGVYVACGVGGQITGRGAHLLLIDDPIKNREEADSETNRRKIKEWFQSTAYTRLMPDGAIVIIQTRWHNDDLAGWLLTERAKEKWKILNLPAIAEKEDEIGRKPGEALWPEWFPIEALEEKKTMVGSREWSALYQQRPTPDEGSIIKLEWFKRFREQPAHPIRIIQSWDTASKANEINDYSVCTTWFETATGYYLIDVFRKQIEYPALKRSVESLAMQYNPTSIIIEDKGSGQSLIQDLRASTRLPVIPILPEKDKVTRMSAVSAMIEAGRVFLPNAAPWLINFEMEVCSFPLAAHDDQVDSVSQALGYFKQAIPFKVLMGDKFESNNLKGY